jgi:hypothetical protein
MEWTSLSGWLVSGIRQESQVTNGGKADRTKLSAQYAAGNYVEWADDGWIRNA